MINNKSTLDSCNCCEEATSLNSNTSSNDHGLATLLYRVRTHGQFKTSMLRGLSDSAVLKKLTIRDDNDTTIALIDTWAVILDILTFYNERIINEGYILTAKERLSLVELARHINYIPKPGVAASSWITFTMEDVTDAPSQAKVPVGTRVQSIPGQDEKAQVFETIEEIVARKSWNKIQPTLFANQVLTNGSTRLYLAGLNTQLQKGDYLLIVGNTRISNSSSDNWALRKIESVIPYNQDNITEVNWYAPIDITNLLVQQNDNQNNAKVYSLRQHASFFGYNAPDFKVMSKEVKISFNGTEGDTHEEWTGFELNNNINSIILDNIYPKFIKGSWVVVWNDNVKNLFKINDHTVISKSNFAMTAKCSQLALDNSTSIAFPRRGTQILGQSEELILTKAPVSTPISGKIYRHQSSLP